VTDGAARFVARHPIVWHVIEADGAGPWLAETGLLPASELLRREDGANRDDFRRIDLGGGRMAVLRPQLMTDARLTASLAGRFAGRPEAWRRHIDSHVFFWSEVRRRDAFRGACQRLRAVSRTVPGTVAPCALAIDTAALLAHCGDRVFFARINTGSPMRGGARARRDETTLAPVATYVSGPVAELAIRGRVPLQGLLAEDDVNYGREW